MVIIDVYLAVAGDMGFRGECISENAKTEAFRSYMSSTLPALTNIEFDILLGARPDIDDDSELLRAAMTGIPAGFRHLSNAAQTLAQARAQPPTFASDPYIIAGRHSSPRTSQQLPTTSPH
jgi:hypothetical protein